MIEGKFLPRPVGTWGHGSSSGFFGSRVKAIAAVPLQKPDEAAKELRHAIKDLGLVGTVVTGTVGQRNLDDPYFEPFFREANAEKAERLC